MEDVLKSVLKKLEQRSVLEDSEKIHLDHNNRMLAITKETGEFYNILLKAIKAKKILEIGTSVGYSTLWFAEAAKENGGHIVTIEKNHNKIISAMKNFEDAGMTNYIEIREGTATHILQKLVNSAISNGLQFDFVFLDADKESNIEYFDLILPIVKIGGIIATDNILYPKKFRAEMQKFVEHIKLKPNIQTITLEIGNGEEITIKTNSA